MKKSSKVSDEVLSEGSFLFPTSSNDSIGTEPVPKEARIAHSSSAQASIHPNLPRSQSQRWVCLCEPPHAFVRSSKSIGCNPTLTADILPRIGATADFTYARSSNLLNAGHHADVLSHLVGPVFYAASYKRIAIYTRVLTRRDAGLWRDSLHRRLCDDLRQQAFMDLRRRWRVSGHSLSRHTSWRRLPAHVHFQRCWSDSRSKQLPHGVQCRVFSRAAP